MVKKIVVLFFCQLFFFNFTTSLILAPTQVGLTEILNLTKTQNEESIQKLRTQALRKKIDVAWELTLDARTSKLCNDPEVEIYYQAAISAWENIKQLHSEVRQADFIRKALIYDLDQTKNITKLNSWTLAFSQKNLNPYFISGERYIFIEAFSKEEQRDYNGAQQIWGNLKSKLGKAEDHDLWARNQNQLVSEISTAIKVWNDAAKEAIDNKRYSEYIRCKKRAEYLEKIISRQPATAQPAAVPAQPLRRQSPEPRSTPAPLPQLQGTRRQAEELRPLPFQRNQPALEEAITVRRRQTPGTRRERAIDSEPAPLPQLQGTKPQQTEYEMVAIRNENSPYQMKWVKKSDTNPGGKYAGREYSAWGTATNRTNPFQGKKEGKDKVLANIKGSLPDDPQSITKFIPPASS